MYSSSPTLRSGVISSRSNRMYSIYKMQQIGHSSNEVLPSKYEMIKNASGEYDWDKIEMLIDEDRLTPNEARFYNDMMPRILSGWPRSHKQTLWLARIADKHISKGWAIIL